MGEVNKQNEQDTSEIELEKLSSDKKHRRVGPAERMWAPIKIEFTPEYQYVSKNKWMRFLYYFFMFAGMPVAYLVFWFRYGYKVIGKKNVKLVKGHSAVTVANHVHNMDSPMLTYAFYPNAPYFIALKHNLEAFVIGGIVRVLRGIPLPSEVRHFERFSSQISEVLQKTNKKIHMYPEASIEPYSRQLRKFKNGAFYFAVKNNVPVVPMVFVFNKRKKVRLIVGEPIKTEDVAGTEGLSEPKQVVLLSRHVKEVMQQMLDEYYGGPQK